jgi:NDP-sugar pyrophosphorylase family protein
MVEVLGIPILGYQIQWLQAQGITEIILSCGYRCEVIQDYFGDGNKWGVHIRYSVEEAPLGRGGGIKRCLSMIPETEELVIATNGDIITNFNLEPVIELHQESGALATIVLTPFISPYGIVEVDGNRVVGFREKPDLPYWINGGIYVLSRGVYDYLPDKGDHEDTTFPLLAKQGRLAAYKSQAYWRAVDTVKDLSEVNRELERRLIGSFLSQSQPP